MMFEQNPQKQSPQSREQQPIGKKRLYYFHAGVLGWGEKESDVVEAAIEFLKLSLKGEKCGKDLCDELNIEKATAGVRLTVSPAIMNIIPN